MLTEHRGKSKLEQPIAIRPTSETVIYPYFSKWIRSHRDLPYKMNQWNSVVRWEFKHPQPFLRSREFYWQEGHTAHLTKEGAGEEVLQILEHYAGVFEKLLAVPIIRGKKTEKEKFAGSEYSMTVEGYIPATGRGIQGATSHCLGQHFSKMYNISVEDPSAKEGEKKDRLHVWQNSWGLSTRVIGVMVMTHGDNIGLVLPPRVAEYQIVIVPVGINVKMADADRASLYAQIDAIAAVLAEAHVWDGPLRLHVDKRDYYSPGWKFAEWEQKGVPLRIEVGPGEIAGHYVSTARRDLPGKTEGGKGRVPITELGVQIPALLERIQADLYARAEAEFKSHTVHVTKWDDFVPALNAKNVCLIPHCLAEECEDEIKKLSARKEDPDDAPEDEKAPSMGAKSLCIPFEQPEGIVRGETKCTNQECGRGAEKWVLFGRKFPFPLASSLLGRLYASGRSDERGLINSCRELLGLNLLSLRGAALRLGCAGERSLAMVRQNLTRLCNRARISEQSSAIFHPQLPFPSRGKSIVQSLLSQQRREIHSHRNAQLVSCP